MRQAIYCLLLLFSASTWAEVVIIANNNVSQTVINSKEVKELFLGKSTQWPGNSPAYPVTMSQQGDVHSSFLKKYAGMKAAHQWTSYWKKMTFTGNGVPPKEFANPQELIDYVASTEGAIGYVDSSSLTDQVVVLEVK